MSKVNRFFDPGEKWEKEWQGMPEFICEDLQPYQTIYVHFASKEDAQAFAKLVEQTITNKTISIWYPKAKIGRYANKRYIDTEEQR